MSPRLMPKIFVRLLVLVALLSCALGLKAQDTSSLVGTVADSSGAVIPGADVTVVNVLTGAKYTQKTDSHGAYHFFGVPPTQGYKITVSHEGFATLEVTGITLYVTQTRTQDAVLRPSASISTTVTAKTADVTLDTTDAMIGSSIGIDQLNDLPIYDRTAGISTLFYLQPGVDSSQGSVVGARVDQSSTTVDGMDVNDIAAGGAFPITVPAPVDSVEQFSGAIAGLIPSLGTGSGAQFQLVTKGGTNKFHGNVNEYNRVTATTANQWFDNLYGIPRTPLIQNQFGGNIGGPIKRDRLFFFFNYAGSRIVESATADPTVPLPSYYENGGQINYINNGEGCSAQSRLNTTPECISTLSASQVQSLDPSDVGISPNMMSFISGRYPKATNPAGGDGVNTGGAPFTYPDGSTQNSYVARVDYQLAQKQRLYGRFTINRTTAVQSGPEFGTDPLTHPFYDKSYAYMISHVWTLGSNKVNQFYFGDNIQRVYFPDIFNPTGANQYSISGLSGPYTGYDGQQRRMPIPEVRDDFNWQKGSHSITFGGLFKWIKTESLLVNDFNFVGIGASGTALGNGLTASVRPENINTSSTAYNDYDSIFAASLGVIGSISTNFNYNNTGTATPAGSGSARNYRYYQMEAYAGDTWKVTRKLTLSYGVRYQLYTAPYETKGDESIPTGIPFDTYIADRETQTAAGNTSNTGLPLYSWQLGGPVNHGPNYFNTPRKDFAPRIAFSYSPFASGKTVVNGGAGIVYDRTVINTINFLQDQISFLFSNSNVSEFGSPAGPAASLQAAPRVGPSLAFDSSLNPPPLPIASPFTPYIDGEGNLYGLADYGVGFVISPNLKDPYSIALNFGVQQELPNHFIFKLNYAGRLGRRLLADADSAQILDAPDYVGHSGQTMVQAFAALTAWERANPNINPANAPAQPWFEDVPAAWGPAYGYASNSAFIASNVYNNIYNGDMSDAIVALANFTYNYGLTGLWPTNIGIPGQFSSNAYLTNMGNSNYHGFLATLNRNYANGLRFDVNYTWSHSIDNTSQQANANALYEGTGLICDVKRPHACRGDSDFDVRQEVNSNFTYDLPFGRGRTIGAGAPGWANEIIGGWALSGIPMYRTGQALSAMSAAYLASDYNEVAANWNGSNRAALKAKVNVDHNSGTVYMFAGGANGAAAAWSQFQGPVGLQYGNRNILRGPGAFTLDGGLAKTFPIVSDKVDLKFRADAYNVLNHPVFGGGGLSILYNASAFGAIGSTNAARVAQFSLRLEF
jgi:hypothetical protein